MLHLVQDMARQHHRDAVLRKRADEGTQLLNAHRIKAVGRLVQDQQPRMTHQRERDPQTLLHAHRELARALPARFGKSHRGQRLVDTAFGNAQKRRAHAQVLPRRQVVVQRGRLDERPDIVQVVARPRTTRESDLARGGPQHAAQHLEQRRLPRAVRSQKAVHRSFRHMQRHPVDRFLPFERPREIVRFHHESHRACPFSCLRTGCARFIKIR